MYARACEDANPMQSGKCGHDPGAQFGDDDPGAQLVDEDDPGAQCGGDAMMLMMTQGWM